jgi:hypothetical protein
MEFTARAMGGMISASDEAIVDDARRSRLIGLALSHARSLPPK